MNFWYPTFFVKNFFYTQKFLYSFEPLPSEKKQAELTKERQERKKKKITDEAKDKEKKKVIETSEETSRKTDIEERKTEKTTKVEGTKADNTIKKYDTSQLLQGKPAELKFGPPIPGTGRRRKRSITPGINGRERSITPGINGRERSITPGINGTNRSITPGINRRKRRKSSKGGNDYLALSGGGSLVPLQVTSVISNSGSTTTKKSADTEGGGALVPLQVTSVIFYTDTIVKSK